MRILVVDDSSFICLICRQILEKNGFEVVNEAYDGIKAVEMARQDQPDLIIMDLALPLQSGLEASRRILTHRPDTLILAISAVDEQWAQDEASEAGCFAFLGKPFDSKQLLSYIEKAKQIKNGGELKYG